MIHITFRLELLLALLHTTFYRVSVDCTRACTQGIDPSMSPAVPGKKKTSIKQRLLHSGKKVHRNCHIAIGIERYKIVVNF